MVSLSNGAILHYENKIMFKLYNEKKKKRGKGKGMVSQIFSIY
jgi:competence protein ComGF